MNHIRVKHEDKNYNCDSCGKSFSSGKILKRHISTFHEGRNHLGASDIQEYKNYKCDSCGQYFSTEDKLKRHISTLHGGQKKCECGHIFKNSSNFSEHNKKCHSKPNQENSEERRNCDKCGFIGSQKFGLFSAHSCVKNQFEANGGGYCTNNCGYFTKIWTNMRNHTRVLICKPKNSASQIVM